PLARVVRQPETEAFSLNLASIDNESRTLEEPCGAYSEAATGKRFVLDGKVHRELLADALTTVEREVAKAVSLGIILNAEIILASVANHGWDSPPVVAVSRSRWNV